MDAIRTNCAKCNERITIRALFNAGTGTATNKESLDNVIRGRKGRIKLLCQTCYDAYQLRRGTIEGIREDYESESNDFNTDYFE